MRCSREAGRSPGVGRSLVAGRRSVAGRRVASSALIAALGVGRIAWMFWRLAHRCPNRFVVRFYRYPRDAKQTGT